MSSYEVFQKYYVELIQCLPMNDVIFIGKLFQKGLLPNDWKAKLNSLPATPAEKAAKFLDNVIEPDVQGGNFTLLLSIMSEDGSMKKLADTIRSEFEPTSTSGSTTSSTDDAVQRLSEDLKEGYTDMGLAKRGEESDPWPPVKITTFTTPVFIHHKQLQTKPKTEAATEERAIGNVEDIPEVTKAPRLKSIEQIFESIDSKCPNRILIEGHPGIGKTTLSKEICVRWAKGELFCSDKLVFLLLLRDPAVQKITNEEQLIEYFTRSPSEVTLIHHYVKEKHGAGITLIIDGFDELNVNLCRKSFFTALMKRKLLNKARVVITSRPLASICFHEIVDKRIEILGFDKSTREQYINEALKNNPNKINKLQQHFQRYPNIDAVCYIPLLLSIMVFLCILEYLPPTTTEMYTSFILHTICHHLKRKGIMEDDEKVTKIDEFPKPVCDVLEKLGKVAFDGLIQGRIVFAGEHLPDHEMSRNDPTCFGLLQSTKCFSAKDIGAPALTFNFYHVELQEYFAAKHIMSLPEKTAYNVIRRHFFIKFPEYSDDEYSRDDNASDDGNSKDLNDTYSEDSQSNHDSSSDSDDDEHPDDVKARLSCVWIFLFGLTKGIFPPLQYYLSTYNDTDDAKDKRSQDSMPPSSKKLRVNPILKIHCQSNSLDLDSQITSIPPTIQNRISQDILSDHAKILFLFHCFQEAQDDQLCRALLQMTFTESSINLENQFLPHHMESLGLFLSKSNHNWKSLNLASCRLEDEDFSEFHHYLCVKNSKTTVEDLNISDNDLTEASFSILTKVISQLQPSCLNLSNNWICFDGLLKHICSTITECSTIKTLHVEMIGMKLSGVTVTMQDREVISNMMSLLRELHIGRNGLYDEGAELLSGGLAKTSSLKVLSVWNCNIFTKGAIALANALSKNTSLKILDLRSNNIDDDGAVAFANVLSKNNETLSALDVRENIFSPKGTTALEQMERNKNSFTCLHAI